MRISLLLTREPFGEILSETLSAFFTARHGHAYDVVWRPGRPREKALRREGYSPWLCNIYLNAIFPVGVDRAVFDPIRREFARSVRRWRTPLQRGYVALATGAWTAAWCAQASIGIRPELPDANHTLIVAGNHKFRVLRASAGVAYAVAKRGWSDVFLERELAAHREAERLGLPIPRILEVAADRRWFSQEYVSGTPLNRLADERIVTKSLRDAVVAVQRLATATRREEHLADYVSQVVTSVRNSLAEVELLNAEQRERIARLIDRVARQVESDRGESATFVTAHAHGDFAPGNILVRQGGICLIDWEYSRRRQWAYDALVYALQTRPTNRLAARFSEIWRLAADELPPPLGSWADLRWDDAARRRQVLLFLLEEIDLHLEENSNPRFQRLPPSLLTAVEQAETVVGMLT